MWSSTVLSISYCFYSITHKYSAPPVASAVLSSNIPLSTLSLSSFPNVRDPTYKKTLRKSPETKKSWNAGEQILIPSPLLLHCHSATPGDAATPNRRTFTYPPYKVYL